jgi:DNA polymerase I
VIHTALSKDISDYENTGPHVAAAQRMQALGQQVGPGVMIRYVVVKGKGKIRDKVKLQEEATQDEYDGDYYVDNQVIPGVERIFDVFGIKIADYFSGKEQSNLSKFF